MSVDFDKVRIRTNSPEKTSAADNSSSTDLPENMTFTSAVSDGFTSERETEKSLPRKSENSLHGHVLCYKNIKSQTECLEILNDPKANPKSQKYAQAIRSWPNNEPIWQHLTSRHARAMLTTYILYQDKLSQHAYIKDPAKPFQCRHFARIMYYRYRPQEDVDIEHLATNTDYEIDKALPKYRMPISEVLVAFDLETQKKIGNVSHAINVVFIGETNANHNDPDNWLFFEPQSDEFLFRSPSYPWKYANTSFFILPDHNDPIDPEQVTPYFKAESDNDLFFILKKDGNLMSMSGSLNFYILLYIPLAIAKGDFKILVNQINEMFYYHNAQIPEIFREVELSGTGNFTNEQLGDLHALQRLINTYQDRPVDFEVSVLIGFLADKETYFTVNHHAVFDAVFHTKARAEEFIQRLDECGFSLSQIDREGFQKWIDELPKT